MTTAPNLAPRVRPVHRRLLSPWSEGLAAVMLVASFLLPERGLGVPLCWFKAAFDLPCPGCGLTRSIVHISHLRFADALAYHPFGFPLYALAVALVVLAVWRGGRRRLVRFLARHDRAAQRVYWLFIGCFIAFGLGRLGLAIASPETAAHL
ncbi:MAG: DUF2752 domain-containing protein [Sandaracinaceae bacterium]